MLALRAGAERANSIVGDGASGVVLVSKRDDQGGATGALGDAGTAGRQIGRYDGRLPDILLAKSTRSCCRRLPATTSPSCDSCQGELNRIFILLPIYSFFCQYFKNSLAGSDNMRQGFMLFAILSCMCAAGEVPVPGSKQLKQTRKIGLKTYSNLQNRLRYYTGNNH